MKKEEMVRVNRVASTIAILLGAAFVGVNSSEFSDEGAEVPAASGEMETGMTIEVRTLDFGEMACASRVSCLVLLKHV